jgi:hypothetical protein
MIALSLAQTIPARMTQTLERLTERGVFELSEAALEDLHTKMEKRAQRMVISIEQLVSNPSVIFISFRP